MAVYKVTWHGVLFLELNLYPLQQRWQWTGQCVLIFLWPAKELKFLSNKEIRKKQRSFSFFFTCYLHTITKWWVFSKMGTMLDWATNQSSCWICGLWSISSTSGLCWWVFPLQSTDWPYLHQYIANMIHHPNTSTYRDISITEKDVSSRPMVNVTCESPGRKRPFSYPQTTKILTEYVNLQIGAYNNEFPNY